MISLEQLVGSSNVIHSLTGSMIWVHRLEFTDWSSPMIRNKIKSKGCEVSKSVQSTKCWLSRDADRKWASDDASGDDDCRE